MEDWRSIRDRIGSWYQIAGTRHYYLNSGSSFGTRAIDVKTGGGLEYTVLPDRGLDISLASFKGVNLVYQGSCGEVNPAYYNSSENEWLRMFYAGLLTTCGPSNIGPPCEDDGETLGLHGRFSSTPARNVCDLTDLESDNGEIRIIGEIDCSVMFGSRIRTKRTICSKIGLNKISIEDVIRNDTGKSVPFAMLYHINMGYPMLDDCVEINVNSSAVESYDEQSEMYLDSINSFLQPDGANREKNYLHKFDQEIKRGRATVVNPKLEIGVSIEFDLDALKYMTQWKQEGIKDYILGLEPCTVPCEKRSVLREKGLLSYLEPGEEKIHKVEIGIIHK